MKVTAIALATALSLTSTLAMAQLPGPVDTGRSWHRQWVLTKLRWALQMKWPRGVTPARRLLSLGSPPWLKVQ